MRITGKAVKVLRAKNGINIVKLSKQADISIGLLSMIETGKATLTKETEAKLLKALYHFGIADEDIALVLTWITLRGDK